MKRRPYDCGDDCTIPTRCCAKKLCTPWGDIGGDIAVALLQQALADPDTAVREAAAEMLEELSAREL